MSGIFGHLNVSDSDRVFSTTAGQRVIYEAATRWVNARNLELNAATALFVERTISDHKLRYKLPGGGHLQKRQADGRYGAVKAYGSWDVAFPLEDFGAQIVGNDVDMAYMTVAELDRHIQTVVAQNVNSVRFRILLALLKNTSTSWTDPLYGSLTLQPLANGDAVVYPPVEGSETEATDDHYLASAYTAANISDTNDPYVTIIDELTEHFGRSSGGQNIVCMINKDQRAKTMDLTDYVDVPDRFIAVGATTDVPFGLPPVPGRILGRHKAGCWIAEWDWIPTNYIVGVYSGEEAAPLMRRIDPADTGLGDGLQLAAIDASYPFQGSFWRHRFGLACGNRLNGVVMFLTSGSSYTIPTGYSAWL